MRNRKEYIEIVELVQRADLGLRAKLDTLTGSDAVYLVLHALTLRENDRTLEEIIALLAD